MENSFARKDIGEVMSYWDKRPCNLRHSPLSVGSPEYYEAVEARKYFVEPHIPYFAEFPRWRGKKVLEIGCGIGTDTMNFARNGAKVTAVDLSAESLALAEKRAEVLGLSDSISFIRADAEHLADYVPPEKYDLIYSFGVIHHTPHPDAVIEQIKTYMNSGSLFKIMVYNKASWKVLAILLKYGKKIGRPLDELIAEYSEAQTGCPVTYSYTPKSLERLLSGLKIQSVFADHIFPYSIPEYTRYEYKKVWYFRILPGRLFRALESRLGWHLCAEARLA